MVIRRCKGWDHGHRFGLWKLLGVTRSRGLGVMVNLRDVSGVRRSDGGTTGGAETFRAQRGPMKPLLRSPLDKYARRTFIAILVGGLVGGGYWCGMVRTRHAERAKADRECARRIERDAARHGFSVVRLAAFPCQVAR